MRLIVTVSSLRRIAALVLIAVWLPAVLHCRIEGFLGMNCCAEQTASQSSKQSCEGDICDALEAGVIKSSTDQITVAPPQLCACLICAALAPEFLPVLESSAVATIQETSAPPEIIHSWHFLSRTALPARAPDCVS